MTTRIRAGVRVLALVAIALLLAGCVRVDMDLELSPQNTVSGSAIFAVEQGIVELSGQTADQLFQDLDLSDLPPGATVEPYEGDGFVGQQVNFADVALSEFSGGNTLGGSGEELSITRVGDDFHVDGRLDMSGGQFSTDQVPPALLDSFEFTVSVTFPGPVASATGAVDGNTVTWEPKIGQDTQIRAVGSAIPSGGSAWLPIILVAVAALVLGAIAFFVLGRRRPAVAEGPVDAAALGLAESAGAGADTGAPAPSPPPPPNVQPPATGEPPAPPAVQTPAPPPAEPTDGEDDSPPPVAPMSG